MLDLIPIGAIAAVVTFHLAMRARSARLQRACVLRLLTDGPMLGLDLVRESKGVLSRGTVYVLLARLEDEGLIESWPIAQRLRFHGETVPRRVYGLKRGVANG